MSLLGGSQWTAGLRDTSPPSRSPASLMRRAGWPPRRPSWRRLQTRRVWPQGPPARRRDSAGWPVHMPRASSRAAPTKAKSLTAKETPAPCRAIGQNTQVQPPCEWYLEAVGAKLQEGVWAPWSTLIDGRRPGLLAITGASAIHGAARAIRKHSDASTHRSQRRLLARSFAVRVSRAEGALECADVKPQPRAFIPVPLDGGHAGQEPVG